MSAATTTAPTGPTLDLRQSRHVAAGVGTWPTKGAALAALAGLRTRGLNLDPGIEAHRAETALWVFWVIGRPDHFNGITYLMTSAGAWVPGRLTDAPCFCAGRCRCHGAPWASLGRESEPATFTHVMRTVPDSTNRHERYKTKSNGSCGRYVWSDDSVALCVCGWKAWRQTRLEARAAAQAHREEMTGTPVGGVR